jgi:hypothetical protein
VTLRPSSRSEWKEPRHQPDARHLHKWLIADHTHIHAEEALALNAVGQQIKSGVHILRDVERSGDVIHRATRQDAEGGAAPLQAHQPLDDAAHRAIAACRHDHLRALTRSPCDLLDALFLGGGWLRASP